MQLKILKKDIFFSDYFHGQGTVCGIEQDLN